MANTSWNLPAPPEFHGLRPDVPLALYVRHLPHWRQDGATYFVTFRLADSLPQGKLHELKLLRAQWQRESQRQQRSPLQDEEDFARRVMLQVEAWLDQGMGECWLKRPALRDIVTEALHHFDGVRYELGCYVIMPNHVHAILCPLQPEEHPLEKILQGRKAKTSCAINHILGRTGQFWQDESFDRIIRDEEHLWRGIQYIGRNPYRAGLAECEWTRWIRPSWQKCGWAFMET